MPNATRITNTGTLLVNGTIDEFTGAPVVNGNTYIWLDAAQTASYPGTGTSWTSLTSQANVATLYNGTAFSTINGGYFTFDGVDDYVQMTPPSNIGSSTIATVEVWANVKSISGMVYGFTSYDIFMTGGAMGFNTGNSDVFGITSANVTALGLAGNWKHYCYVMYNNVSLGGTTYNNNKIYVNGVSQPLQQVTGNISSTIRTISGNLTIGGWTNNVAQYKPSMDSSVIKVYDRELTQAEVLQNYNALAGRYGLAANTSGTAIQRTTSTTVLAEQFDEVTYNTDSPTIKNNFIYSQDQSNVAWTKQNSVVTANAAIAPDGTLTASKLVGNNGATGRKSVYQNRTITANTNYTYSVYLKKAEFDSATIWFDVPGTTPNAYQGAGSLANLTLGTVSGSQTSITNVGNGWYRCATTASSNVSSVNFQVSQGDPNGTGTPAGDGTSGIYIWGEQLELGNTATIYQPIAAANTLVTTGMAQRVDSGGNMYVSNIFDEFTGAPIVDGNLKVWLDAGQTASYPGTGTVWYDLSNNGSNAVLFNSVSYNSSSGGAMSLNGGYIAISAANAANVTTTTAVTASIWVNSTTADTNYRRIISRDSFPTQNWYIEYNGDPASVGNVFSYSGTASTGQTPITSNVWYNLTLTANASSVSLYKNGVLTNFNGSATTFLANTAGIGIGADANGGSPMLGNISQVMIYNRVLTADEVTTNFNAMRNRYGI